MYSLFIEIRPLCFKGIRSLSLPWDSCKLAISVAPYSMDPFADWYIKAEPESQLFLFTPPSTPPPPPPTTSYTPPPNTSRKRSALLASPKASSRRVHPYDRSMATTNSAYWGRRFENHPNHHQQSLQPQRRSSDGDQILGFTPSPSSATATSPPFPVS
jgi:hypothetical protein